MRRIWPAMIIFAAVGLVTACGASGPASTGSGALSPSSLITADTRAPAKPPEPPLAEGQRSGDLLVWLSSAPTQPVEGNAQLDTFIAGSNGEPLTGAHVTYDTDMTNMSHGLYLVPADPAADGHYVGRVHFSMPGPWRVITIIERPGLPTVRLRFAFRVNGQ